MLAFAAHVLWVTLALPVQEPKHVPPTKTTNNQQLTTNNSPWTPKDKETVVLLGSAFIEQAAHHGYLETERSPLSPNKDIRVRNLGWSGDTVHCQARAYFGPPEEGFERLRGHLAMIKPTTVICCYGANESWKGEPGIPDFRKAYERLIDMIRQTTGATVVLMTLPPYGPDVPPEASDRLSVYSRCIAEVAASKQTPAIYTWNTSIFRSSEITPPLTKDALLTPAGYAYIAEHLFPSSQVECEVNINLGAKKVVASQGNAISGVEFAGGPIRWTMTRRCLPPTGV